MNLEFTEYIHGVRFQLSNLHTRVSVKLKCVAILQNSWSPGVCNMRYY